MRIKLVLSIAAFLLAIAATSCQKKNCYECTTTRYVISNNDTLSRETELKPQCDLTKKDVMKIEENGTHTYNYFQNGAPTVETQSTTCDYN